jgi:CheY-like chemotaxis protein
MKKSTTSSSQSCGRPERRVVLVVDADSSYADTLSSTWSQLRLADELRVVQSREEALNFLHDSFGSNGSAPIAAVVLDPDATGEDTGAFLREVRKHWGKTRVPTVFWTRDGEKYDVLEGRGVDSVLKKPMVLRLIQALDTACQLRVQRFSPFAGSSTLTERKVDRTPE